MPRNYVQTGGVSIRSKTGRDKWLRSIQLQKRTELPVAGRVGSAIAELSWNARWCETVQLLVSAFV